MSTITPMPTAPTRTDPNTFSARADAWDAALVLLGPEINVVAGEVNANAVFASTASGQAGVYAASASVSATAATAAASLVNVLPWTDATYAIGDPRYSLINLQTYRCKTAGVRSIDPALDLANWQIVTALPEMAGQAGKDLGTDGTSAVWRVRATNAYQVISLSRGDTPTIAAGNNFVTVLIDSAPGSTNYQVTLPLATGYLNGDKLIVDLGYGSAGLTSYCVLLQDSTGLYIALLTQYLRTAVLTSDGTTWSVAAPSMNVPVLAGTQGFGVAAYVTAGAYGVRWAVMSTDNTTPENSVGYVTAPRTFGARATSPSPPFYNYSNNMPTPTFLTETLLLNVGSTGATNGAIATTHTVGNGTNVYNTSASWDSSANTLYGSPIGLCRTSDTAALTVYGSSLVSNIQACMVTVSGTTPTAQTRFTVPSTGGPGWSLGSYLNVGLSATSALILAGSSSALACMPVSISGSNLTFDTAWTSIGTKPTSNQSDFYACALDATRVLVVFNNSADSYYLSGRVITVSGTTVSMGSVTRLYAVANNGAYGVGCALLPNGKIYAFVQAMAIRLTIAGSTITVVPGTYILPATLYIQERTFAANIKSTGPNTVIFSTSTSAASIVEMP